MDNEITNTEITTTSENLPIAGDALIGQIVGIRSAVGTYGESLQVLVKDEAGNITAAWLTQWLKENLRAQGAGEGERVNARLKDEFGGRVVRVRGHAKVLCHLMFGVLALTANQMLILVT